MLPVYVSYFAGGGGGKRKALVNALGFTVGFTIVFIVLGAFSGGIGRALQRHGTAVNIVTGLVVVLFGLNYLGILKIGFLNRSVVRGADVKDLGFWSSMVFGVVFSAGWTPCVGAFLGSAMMIAAQQGSVIKGIIMLLVYSLGLGIPFIVSAVLIDRLKGAFDFIKRNYKVINYISGSLLIVVGILMITGTFGFFLSLLTF